ncbi:pyridoxamine 5'-phosphate oxidase family protein [Niallia endozanthoxylica]|uniref:Pyridoxamine 5'-phosphate oxidase family protein n=1 Tax=Niallia endozanthoxylica TaxID=2036016 RepID=A0A5J5I466_9BACI|nr:pyridoxamine 5'-phosphate oxidase family protein [Niallia endozanthoxylica]KAA9028444.1 pyridoxamine 5'-phosphate oxidase family protein [Niallia endozanthoxylica]
MEPSVSYQGKIETEEELRSIIGYPSELVKRKVITHIDSHCKDFISRSPFLVISTSDDSGYCDVSPRGDRPGFVLILDESHIVIPERPGNKRSDTLRNILSNPNAGLLFLIPGLGETLRVNGKATLVKDDSLLERMAANGKKPLLGILVEVEECFIHCAKAMIRSGLWRPESWSDKDSLPNASKILADHVKLPGMTEETIKSSLKEDYKTELY